METTPRTENERPSEKVTWEQAISLLSSAAGISLIYLSPSLCLLDVLRIKETGLGLHLEQDLPRTGFTQDRTSPRTGHFISPSGGRSPPPPPRKKGYSCENKRSTSTRQEGILRIQRVQSFDISLLHVLPRVVITHQARLK